MMRIGLQLRVCRARQTARLDDSDDSLHNSSLMCTSQAFEIDLLGNVYLVWKEEA